MVLSHTHLMVRYLPTYLPTYLTPRVHLFIVQSTGRAASSRRLGENRRMKRASSLSGFEAVSSNNIGRQNCPVTLYIYHSSVEWLSVFVVSLQLELLFWIKKKKPSKIFLLKKRSRLNSTHRLCLKFWQRGSEKLLSAQRNTFSTRKIKQKLTSRFLSNSSSTGFSSHTCSSSVFFGDWMNSHFAFLYLAPRWHYC